METQRIVNAKGRRASDAVVAAATALFASRGYDGTSLADVAADAGVAKPSVLYHFADKPTLWRHCVDTLWARVDAFYGANWPATILGRDGLHALCLLFVRAALAHPAYIRIPFIEGATPSWRSEWLVDRHFGAHVAATDRVIRACQRRGLIAPDADPAHVQAVLTGGVNMFVAQGAMWRRAFGRDLASAEQLAAQVAHAIDLTFRSEPLDTADALPLAFAATSESAASVPPPAGGFDDATRMARARGDRRDAADGAGGPHR